VIVGFAGKFTVAAIGFAHAWASLMLAGMPVRSISATAMSL
jgi:hypothetical protein